MQIAAKRVPRHSSFSDVYYTEKAVGPLLDKVFSLRYRSYRFGDYIPENPSRKFMDTYDSQTNCSSYLLYENKRAIASIRSCVYDPESKDTVPCMEIFEEEIKDAIGLDNVFVEVNKLVMDPLYQSKRGHRVRMLLFSTVVAETQKSLAKNVVVAVRPEHMKFYSRFGCEPISTVKRYPKLNFDTVLMVCKDDRIEKVSNKIVSRSTQKSKLDESVYSNSHH